MENRIFFRERLTDLKTAADEAGGVLTQTKIRDILKDLPLEEDHFRLINEYLAEQGIRVLESEEQAGSRKSKDRQDKTASDGKASDEDALEEADPAEETSDESRRSLSMYLEELESLADVDDAEEIRLLECVRKGDSAAKERLIGLYLPMICTMAEEYEEETLASEDLIQEGNLGLLTAIDSLDTFESAAACRVHIINTVRGAMEKAMSDSRDGRKMDNGLLSRVNHLNEAVHNLERDLGHKVSAEEVSAYLEMPIEEIEDLLRVSGDQIV
ncbi:MAG: hypothetical protein LUI14_05185 [Lachnospiraceae bacterium]|nr:hypothetical protein [Lachnospiraceae bacterium]